MELSPDELYDEGPALDLIPFWCSHCDCEYLREEDKDECPVHRCQMEQI